MSKKIYSIISIIICIMLIFLIQNTVYAASAKMTVSSTKVETGKSVTITANISSAATWDLDISTTGGTLEKNNDRVGNTDSGNNENKTATLGTFSAGTAGSYKVTLSGYVVDGDTLSKVSVNDTVTIVVEDPAAQQPETPPATITPEKPTTSTTGTSDNKPTEVKKSSEARLKKFGINPQEYDFSGFSKNPDKENWSTEVPNSVTSVDVYAEPKDSKAKVSGTGKVTLNEGNNKIGVKVTAEDGTTKTYTLTIKRKTVDEENAENGENRLKSLSINPEEYDFKGFKSDITEYTAEVPNEVEEIEIVAIAQDSKAQITGTGIIELEEGENELKIEVIAVNGDKKIYTLNVTRKEAEKKEKLGLSTLSIKGLKLTPIFKEGTYEYKVELKEDLNSLEITAKSNSENATVQIAGNENLKQGENIITILVEDKEKKEVATYQIIVNKNLPMVVEEIQTSWLKPSTWGKEEIIKISIIIVLIILLICAIILKIKISKENPKIKKVDLPGAEELDKAITEHQELIQEENIIEEFEQNKNDEIPRKRGRHF